MTVSAQHKRPRLLLSNDDGVGAPGLQALAAAIVEADFCDLLVCGPAGEQSAQSHSITLTQALRCFPIDIPGALEAFAVEGSPADSVMLALNSQVFLEPHIDLVVSGINRGDNAGLHVIYSGTVGAAREGACKGLPAVAISLASHRVTCVEDYAASAAYCVPLLQAMLSQLQSGIGGISALSGYVLNVNVPAKPASELRGYYLTHQGLSSVYPAFQEIGAQDARSLAAAEATARHAAAVACEAVSPDGAVERQTVKDSKHPNSVRHPRMFRNRYGHVQTDTSEGCDSWALAHSWVSVTPLGLLSHIALPGMEQSDVDTIAVSTAAKAIAAAAVALGVAAGGLTGCADGRL